MYIAQLGQEIVQLLHLENYSLGSVKGWQPIVVVLLCLMLIPTFHQSSTAAKLCMYVRVMYNLY